MVQYVVFLVHGMGTHTEDWADEGIKVLKEAAKAYPDLASPSVWEDIVFKPLLYGDVLEGILADWATLTKDVLDQAPAGDRPSLKKLLGKLEKSDDTFVKTHLMDVVLWRFHPYARNLVLATLSERLVEQVNACLDAPGSVPNISILAHSLGTSVVHTLAEELAAGRFLPPGARNPFDPEQFRFHTLAMVANVACILAAPGQNVYGPLLRPSQGACLSYQSFEHVLDPCTRFQPFDAAWPGPVYQRVRVNHVRQVNVHALEHFLLHPGVYLPLLSRLFPGRFMPDRADLDRIPLYPRFPDPIPEAIQARADMLEALQDPGSKLIDVLDQWLKVF